jgi:hypothetical protein
MIEKTYHETAPVKRMTDIEWLYPMNHDGGKARTEDTARRSRNQMKHCVDVSTCGRKQHFEN